MLQMYVPFNWHDWSTKYLSWYLQGSKLLYSKTLNSQSSLVSELYLLLTWAVTWHYLLIRSDRSSASAESILELKQNYLRLQSLKLSWLSVSMSQQSVRAWENGRRGGDCCMTSVSSFVSQHPPQLCETLWHFQMRWIITKSWDLKSSECFLLT